MRESVLRAPRRCASQSQSATIDDKSFGNTDGNSPTSSSKGKRGQNYYSINRSEPFSVLMEINHVNEGFYLLSKATMGYTLTLAERDKLTPHQLLSFATMGNTLTGSERAKLNSFQLLSLRTMGQDISEVDRRKFNGHQLLSYATMGHEITASEQQRLSRFQLMAYHTMGERT
jgi:hypothetical protein